MKKLIVSIYMHVFYNYQYLFLHIYNEDILMRYGNLPDFIFLVETNYIPFKNNLFDIIEYKSII